MWTQCGIEQSHSSEGALAGCDAQLVYSTRLPRWTSSTARSLLATCFVPSATRRRVRVASCGTSRHSLCSSLFAASSFPRRLAWSRTLSPCSCRCVWPCAVYFGGFLFSLCYLPSSLCSLCLSCSKTSLSLPCHSCKKILIDEEMTLWLLASFHCPFL